MCQATLKLKAIKSGPRSQGSYRTTTCKLRRENVVLSIIRIGHTALTHKFQFEKVVEPTYQPTVKHILVECLGLEEKRRKVGMCISMREILADDSK